MPWHANFTQKRLLYRHNNIRRIGDAHTLQRYHSEQRILDLLSGESQPPARPPQGGRSCCSGVKSATRLRDDYVLCQKIVLFRSASGGPAVLLKCRIERRGRTEHRTMRSRISRLFLTPHPTSSSSEPHHHLLRTPPPPPPPQNPTATTTTTTDPPREAKRHVVSKQRVASFKHLCRCCITWPFNLG